MPYVNGEFFARDFANIDKEITLGYLIVIIEFPSKEDAVSAYEIRGISKDDSFKNSIYWSNSYYLWESLIIYFIFG